MPLYDPKTQNGASPVSIPKMDAFSQALGKQLKQSAGISKIDVIKLGNPAATSSADALFVASNPNYMYYTTEGEEGAGIGMISKEIIPPSLRFPNKTALIFRYGSYVACLPAAGVAEEILAEGTPPVTPNQTPVTTSQLDFAVLQPYVGTMYAIVKGAIYGDVGVADISTADMSDSPLDTLSNPINIPTNANMAIGVLVQLDTTTDPPSLSYKQSAEFPASLSLAQAYLRGDLPLRDEGKYRTGYIKLANGVTSLNNGNVWPCPEFFPTIPTPNELVFDAPTELTIASGAITVTGSWHTIDTESNAATDDLDTINGLETGRFYLLQAEDAAREVVVRSGSGNIRTFNGVPISLNGVSKGLIIQYDGSTVNVLTSYNNPNEMQDWGSYPDSDLWIGAQDDASGDFYRVRGDEMRMHETWTVIGGDIGANSSSEMVFIFDDTTDRTVTLSSVLNGHSLMVKAKQVSGGTGHKLLLPSGCYWNNDGINRAMLLNATTDWAIATAWSSTNYEVITSNGVTYAAS